MNQVGAKLDIEDSKNCTLAVIGAAGVALQTVDIYPIALATGVFDWNNNNYGNNCHLNGHFSNEIKRVCAKKLVAEFGCKLAGVDVKVESACDTAQNFLRVDA
jgi:hypothetical protein